MIYLFDDKKNRQESYGWTENEFKLWEGKLTLVRDYSEYLQLDIEEVISDGNIILYHESFPTCVPYSERQSFQSFHDYIIGGDYSTDIKVAKFSGSITNRDTNGNIAFLPVTNLYSNLESFINHVDKYDIDFKYLLWGEDYEVEQELLGLIEEFDNEITEDDNEGEWSNVFFATAQKYGIDSPSDDCIQETLWLSQVTDADFENYIQKWFTQYEYDSIYLPLCFGRTLSDYNGLRFAIHIRCTKSLNRTKPIYIYSPVNESYLLKSPYFDILKTKGVKLVKMDAKHLAASIDTMQELSSKELSNEMKKVNLPIPQNYEDSHSIANDWAVHRWAVATDSEDRDIVKLEKDIESNLYFKHLSTIYSPTEIQVMNEKKLRFKYNLSDNAKNLIENMEPKILFVDDDVKKWSEILTNIIVDINHIPSVNFDCLLDNLRSLSPEELVEFVVERVKDTQTNILLLDFRLHKQDHQVQNIEDITSVRILKKIKEFNPGIQVVFFSATNKVWNLLALQKFGADGFVIKESVDNSKDSTFTVNTIESFINIMSECIFNIYKKYLFENTSNIIEEMKQEVKLQRIDGDLYKACKLFFDIAYHSLPTSLNGVTFDHSFLNYFRIIEAISNDVIDSEPIPDEQKPQYIPHYKNVFKFRRNDDYLLDFDEEQYSCSDQILALPMTRIPHCQKFYNMFYHLKVYWPSTYDIVKKRNNITHANTRINGKIKPITIEDVLLAADICFKCIRNLICMIKKEEF